MAEREYGLRQLRALAGGNEEFVESMIHTFLEHTPGQLEELMNAYGTGDLKTVGEVGHKIKPNIDLFEIEAIRDDIRRVENQGKNGINNEALAGSVEQVEQVLNRVFQQMRDR